MLRITMCLALFATTACTPSPVDKTTATPTAAATSHSSAAETTHTEARPQAKSADLAAALAAAPKSRTVWQRTLISHDCLQGKGYKPRIDPAYPDQMSFVNTGGKAGADARDRATDECDKKYQLTSVEPMTRAKAMNEYEYRVKMLECLRQRGHALSNPPSKQAFVDKLLKSESTKEDLAVWSPHDELADQMQTSPRESEKACPRNPTP